MWRSGESEGSVVVWASVRSLASADVREVRGTSPRRECWRERGLRLVLSLVGGGRRDVFEALRELGRTKRVGAGVRWGLGEAVWGGLFAGDDILVWFSGLGVKMAILW